jgi:cytochrome c2
MKLPFLLSFAAVLLALPANAQEADLAAGKSAFAKCSSCHAVGENAKNRMGPYLTGVVGRPAASVEGFTYSKAMVAAGENGLVWTPEALDGFIAAPHDYVPGTKMPNVAVADPATRANLIAYLQTFSPDFDASTQVSTYEPPNGAAPASATTPTN